MWESEWKSPKMLRIHRTTAITTTPFKIDLMVACMGMNRFTSHSSTPTTTRTSRSWIKGMVLTFLLARANAPHPLEVLPWFTMFEILKGRIVLAGGFTAYTRMKIADWLDVAAWTGLSRSLPATT
jgi:hypothetical protein